MNDAAKFRTAVFRTRYLMPSLNAVLASSDIQPGHNALEAILTGEGLEPLEPSGILSARTATRQAFDLVRCFELMGWFRAGLRRSYFIADIEPGQGSDSSGDALVDLEELEAQLGTLLGTREANGSEDYRDPAYLPWDETAPRMTFGKAFSRSQEEMDGASQELLWRLYFAPGEEWSTGVDLALRFAVDLEEKPNLTVSDSVVDRLAWVLRGGYPSGYGDTPARWRIEWLEGLGGVSSAHQERTRSRSQELFSVRQAIADAAAGLVDDPAAAAHLAAVARLSSLGSATRSSRR